MKQEATTPTGDDRLAVVRRVYFYLIALASFIAGLFALDNLLRIVDEAWFRDLPLYSVSSSDYVRDAIASSGGLLLVATPIFLFHWGYVQRQTSEEERRSALRKFFLYTAAAVSLGFALVRSYSLIDGLVQLVAGQNPADSSIWPSGWLYRLIVILIGVLLQAYFHRVAIQDGDYGTENGAAGVLRRLYQLLAGLVGLALVIFGVSELISTVWSLVIAIWSPAVGNGWWRMPIGNGVAGLLVGSVLVRTNWQRWQSITHAHPHEARTALRRLYLYAGVVVGALAALVPAALILRKLLLLLFGSGDSDLFRLLDELAEPIGYVPIGLAVWFWYRRFLSQEAEAYGDSPESTVIRRIYYYAVAATGLALVWFGAVGIVHAVLDWIFRAETALTPRQIWAEPLATGLSLLVFGAPVWAYHWRAVQTVARGPEPLGTEERGSAPRKIYLYGVALVGALLILFYVARVVYRILLVVLGDPDAGLLSAETAEELARSAIAAILWSIHIAAIRTDTQLGTTAPREEEGPSPQYDTDSREMLIQRIDALDAELVELRSQLAALDAENENQPDG